MKEISIDYKKKNGGHYSRGMVHNGLLYVSGQLPVDPNTGVVADGGIVEQAKQALSNFDDILNAAGSSRKEVIQCRVYVSDVKYWESVNDVYSKFFGDHKPARAIVPTRELHFGSLIEIEGIAIVK